MMAIDEPQPLAWFARGRHLIAEAKEAGMERAIGFSHKNSARQIDGGIALGTDQMTKTEFACCLEHQVPLLYTIYSIAYQHIQSEARLQASLDHFTITPRQNEVIMALWCGHSNKQIAYKLGVSEVTVSFHLNEPRKKLGCKLNREILPTAYKYGLLHMGG